MEWQKKGYIVKIRHKWYCFPEFLHQGNAHLLIANTMYSPSYVSLETALSYHGIIPETVVTITSVTTKKTYTVSNKTGDFNYAHIKKSLFFGYEFVPFTPEYRGTAPEKQRQLRIADAEKALLDFFYIRKKYNTEAEIRALRMDPDILEEDINKEKLARYLDIFKSRALEKRISLVQGVSHG